MTGVGLADTGHAVGDPIAGIGSFIVLFDMLLFGWLVFRAERTDADIGPMRAPVR